MKKFYTRGGGGRARIATARLDGLIGGGLQRGGFVEVEAAIEEEKRSRGL